MIYTYINMYIYTYIYIYIYYKYKDWYDWSGDIYIDLYRSEIHIYINDICINFPSRVTVAHSIPAHSFSIKKI
jgi:hypothetical protein